MKGNELRIGNLVCLTSDVGDFPEYIETTVGVMDIEHAINQEEFFEGIPITEEWLMRFGFEMKNSHVLRWDKNSFLPFTILFDPIIKHFQIGYVGGRAFKRIEYIHQLQNLHFALTGEEL